MKAYRAEATVSDDKSLVLKAVPFRAGDTVEVIVLEASERQQAKEPISLARNTHPIRRPDRARRGVGLGCSQVIVLDTHTHLGLVEDSSYDTTLGTCD
jgi:hypothetical protein